MREQTLLRRGRRDAERPMLDTCVIDRPGESVTDPDGIVTPSYTPVYAGRCKVQLTASQAASPESAGAVFNVQRSRLDLPVGVGPIASGDRVRIVTAMSNPALVGNTYRVTELFEKSWQTAQRIPIEELT